MTTDSVLTEFVKSIRFKNVKVYSTSDFRIPYISRLLLSLLRQGLLRLDHGVHRHSGVRLTKDRLEVKELDIYPYY